MAADTAGLQVVNCLSIDTQGQAPIVAIDTASLDVDAVLAGVQANEGSIVPVLMDVSNGVRSF